LTSKKSQQTPALQVLQEQSSFEAPGQPSAGKRLPPLPVEEVNPTSSGITEDTEAQPADMQAASKRAKTGIEMRTVQLAEDPRKIHSAEIKTDKSPPLTKVVSTTSSEIPKNFELISMEEKPVKSEGRVESTPAETGSPREKVQPPKVVCGLPCDNKRKERELNYTLDILTGIRSRKDEDKLRAEAKRLEMKKAELKKAASGMKGGMAKRRIM